MPGLCCRESRKLLEKTCAREFAFNRRKIWECVSDTPCPEEEGEGNGTVLDLAWLIWAGKGNVVHN